MKLTLSFKEFLAESSHKKSISVEEAIKLINTHCRDTVEPLWRGMSRSSVGSGGDAYMIHGEESSRASANTDNFYTVTFDKFLPAEGYPKRAKSIILSNSIDTARGFGQVYAILPYDDVPIGVCVDSDLWHSGSFQIGNSGYALRINNWNSIWKDCGLSDESFEAFVSSIKEKMSEPESDAGKRLIDIFETADNVIPALKKAYSANTFNFKLATTKTIQSMKGERELWISGKCIAIEKHVWDSMKKDDHDEDEAPDEDEDDEDSK